MNDHTMAQAVRRRDDGLRGVSNLTAALAALSIVGTGAVAYAAANHSPATTATTGTGTAVDTRTTSATTSGTTTAPAATTGAPVAATHGS
jgi:hypothetical protein